MEGAWLRPLRDSVSALLTLSVHCDCSFFLNNRSMWDGFLWVKHISFVQYGYTALLVNEYEGLVRAGATTASALSRPDSCAHAQTFTCEASKQFRCLDTGEKVLDSMGVVGESVWLNILYLVILAIGLRVLAYWALRRFSRPVLKLG